MEREPVNSIRSIKGPSALHTGSSDPLVVAQDDSIEVHSHWSAKPFLRSVGFLPEYHPIGSTGKEEFGMATDTFFDVSETFSPTCSTVSDDQLTVEFLPDQQSMDRLNPGQDLPVYDSDSRYDQEAIGQSNAGYASSLETTSSAHHSVNPSGLTEVVIAPLEISLPDQHITSPSGSQGEMYCSHGTACASLDRGYFQLPLSVTVSTPSGSDEGLKRLWEGGLFEIGDHSDVALQTACCPCATFGKNMERAGFGTSWGQGGVYLLLSVGALSFYIVFACTGSPWFIYGTLSMLLLMAMYGGHYRARMRRRFNIIGSEGDDVVSTIDDHMYHLMCGFCSLCQEARTLKSNNVHNGVWHGRSDILVIGSQVVFSPAGAPVPNSANFRRPPPWRMRPAPCMEPVVVTVASDSDSDEQHPWSPQSLQSVPLMKQ